MKYAIPTCPTCGASLPHSNPMAWQYHNQQEERNLFNEAVSRARTLGRPFQVEEVFKVIWETTGLELVPQADPEQRFVLVKEATGKQRRLWGLRLCLHCYEHEPTINETYCASCADLLGKEYMHAFEQAQKEDA